MAKADYTFALPSGYHNKVGAQKVDKGGIPVEKTKGGRFCKAIG